MMKNDGWFWYKIGVSRLKGTSIGEAHAFCGDITNTVRHQRGITQQIDDKFSQQEKRHIPNLILQVSRVNKGWHNEALLASVVYWWI
jgi:hypothetical protein